MKRIGLVAACLIGFAWVNCCTAADPPPDLQGAEPGLVWAQGILRDAAAIALKQPEQRRGWKGETLRHICRAQTRARDFEGAIVSLRGSDDPNGEPLVDLADAVARAGQRARAFDLIQQLDPAHGWNQAELDDGVQTQWIEHLIASHKFAAAREAIDEFKLELNRVAALCCLATAQAKAGKTDEADASFALAFASAGRVANEFGRVCAAWEIATAQVAAGSPEAAKAAAKRLIELPEPTDAWAKESLFRESAIVAAKAGDDELARRQFQRAIEAAHDVDDMNRQNALKLIAEAQAGVGFREDALQTAAALRSRASVLLEVLSAQVRANDLEGDRANGAVDRRLALAAR